MRDTDLKPISREIKGKTFLIRKFSAKQTLTILKIIAKANKDGKLGNLEVEENNMFAMLTTIFNNLEVDDTMDLFCVMLNTDDKKFVEENVDIDNLPDILGDVLKLNSIGELSKKAGRIAEVILNYLPKK